MKELTEEEILSRMAAYCSKAEHCPSEVRDKMERTGVPEAIQERVLEKLCKERFVDEVRYVRAFIHDKVCYDKWGRRKIDYALRQKGIDESLRASSMSGEIDEQLYEKNLRNLLEQKRRSVKARDDYELNGKLMRFALGRGYEAEEIQQCLQE